MSLTSLTILNDDELKLLEHRMSNLLGDDVLMRRAGEAAAAWIRGEINEGERVTVLAGPGNNGGDAVCAALALRREGVAVELVMPGPAKSDLCRRMVELLGIRHLTEHHLPFRQAFRQSYNLFIL